MQNKPKHKTSSPPVQIYSSRNTHNRIPFTLQTPTTTTNIITDTTTKSQHRQIRRSADRNEPNSVNKPTLGLIQTVEPTQRRNKPKKPTPTTKHEGKKVAHKNRIELYFFIFQEK